MAIKPFAIQGADLILGGINLQAGTTGVVIPGVTQATSYKVEEVDDTGEQTTTVEGTLAVLDSVQYNKLVDNGSADISGYATYTIQLDDASYIDSIEVDSQGSYTQQEATTNESANMWVPGVSENVFDPFVSSDWFQVPFRPKMRAGVVETIGGSSGDRLVNDDNELVLGETGHLTFPDGSIQTTAFTGVADNNIWIETFASDAPTTDFVQSATSVEYDLDGNIIVLFNHIVPTNSNETYTSVAKLSPTGAVLWRVRFGTNLNADGWGLAYDAVYNYIYIAGSTSGPGIYKFATLTKLSSLDGSLVWSKTYDFEADSQSSVVDVGQAGDPVMVGYAYNGVDNYIVTTRISKSDGSVVWCKTLNGQGYDQAYGMAVGPDSEVVTIGYVDSYGPTDAAATLYTDPVSNVNWVSNADISVGNFGCYVTFTDGVPTFTNIIDPTGGRTVDDIITTVSGVSFGGTSPADDMIIKVATVAVNDTDDRMVVVKYTSDGTIAWQKAVQFEVGYNCSGADADIDSLGNIYVCGQYNYNTGDGSTAAMSLVKFNSSGVKQWSRRVVGNCETFGTSVVLGDDGYLYLSGVTGNNNTSDFIWVAAKYDTSGVVVWQRLIDNTTTWSFGGGFWFSGTGGGSNIAVHDGYVALAGAFADPFVNQQATAVVVQINTAATPFSVGDWDVKGATFSGVLNDSASDITVSDAGKTAGNAAPTVTDFINTGDFSNFLTVTRYSLSGSSSSIDNGSYSVSVGNTGTVTLPAGGTITEGVVTSNPTIQLTPASPDVASQKLVIKGGGAYNANTNGIALNWYVITALVGETIQISVNSSANANQTLYWWINPAGAGISTPDSGTVTLIDAAGDFSFVLDSADYEFTVRVSPVNDQYDPANTGVETLVFNSSAPTFTDGHHLHLTTGDLTETSIFLGTDDHNVRTTVDGSIQITTPNVSNNIWQFGTDGSLTLPANSSILTSNTALKIATSPTTTYTFTQSYWEAVDGDITRVVTPTGNAQYFACTVTANQDGTYTVAVTGAGNSFAPGNWFKVPGNELGGVTPANDIQINIATVDVDGVILTTTITGTAVSKQWQFGTDGALTFPDATVQTTAFVQGEQVFTLDTGAIDYAPTVVDFNLLFVTPAIGYSSADPTSVTLPAGVPGQRLVIFNGSSLATLTVNPGLLGRDISAGVVAEFIYSGFDGLWIPLYGTNSPT